MTLVKVIDSTTWAGLTELDISESDDLSASLVNDTYRLIHSATTALVVAAVTLVSGAPASISMTAYAATVETPSAAVTVTSASPAAITMTAYGADVSVSGGAVGFSDDFKAGTLGGGWTFTANDKSGGSNPPTQGFGNDGNDYWLYITIPNTTDYDLYADTTVPNVHQTVTDGDFDVRTRFLSTPNAQYQNQGFFIRDSAEDDWIRYDIFGDTGPAQKLYAVTDASGTKTTRVSSVVVTGTGTDWLRVVRSGDDWELFSSTDGSSWTSRATFTFAMTVNIIGLFCASSSGSPSYTAQFDHIEFINDAISDPEGGEP